MTKHKFGNKIKINLKNYYYFDKCIKHIMYLATFYFCFFLRSFSLNNFQTRGNAKDKREKRGKVFLFDSENWLGKNNWIIEKN